MTDRAAIVYVCCWSLACMLALGVAWHSRSSLRLFTRAYWRWLLAPWKVAIFAIAWFAMIALAPYSGDPTWDWVDGGGQSLLAFATAPWAVGLLLRALLRREPVRPAEGYVATCCWLFSASWFYDGWLWLRDGFYPRTWSSNLLASSALYLLVGVLFGLEDGAPTAALPTLGCLEPNWPRPNATHRKVRWVAAAVIAFTIALLSPFLWMAWERLRR